VAGGAAASCLDCAPAMLFGAIDSKGFHNALGAGARRSSRTFLRRFGSSPRACRCCGGRSPSGALHQLCVRSAPSRPPSRERRARFAGSSRLSR
jgi:hypothetical protein